MSARLTPEELRRIAPEEYARQYGKPEEPKPKPPAKPRAESPAAVARWWLALLAVLGQFAFAVYLMTHY